MTTRPAPKPIRRVISKPLRNSARGRKCTLRWAYGCDGGETTVLAHIRGTWSGVAMKPTDLAACYACHACNMAMESSYRPGAGDVLRAMIETLEMMTEAGLITVKGD
jgi:hypothetical protein